MQSDIEKWEKARNHPAFPAVIGSLLGGALSTIVIYVVIGLVENLVAIFMFLFYVGSFGLIGVMIGSFLSFRLLLVFLFRSGFDRNLGEKEKDAIKSHRILLGVSGFFFTFIINIVFFFWAIQ